MSNQHKLAAAETFAEIVARQRIRMGALEQLPRQAAVDLAILAIRPYYAIRPLGDNLYDLYSGADKARHPIAPAAIRKLADGIAAVLADQDAESLLRLLRHAGELIGQLSDYIDSLQPEYAAVVLDGIAAFRAILAAAPFGEEATGP